MAYHRSVSQLTSFTRCGEAYRISRFVKDLPRRPAAWLAVGSAMHTAYELWENTNRTLNLADQFKVDYVTEVADLKRQQPDLAWWVKAPNMGRAGESVEDTITRDIEIRGEAGAVMAAAYQVHCEQAKWKLWKDEEGNPAIEVPFTLQLGDTEVIGKVDSILEWPDGRLSIRDLKSGNVGEPDNRQIGTYALAMKECVGLDITWGEYFYTKTGKSGGMKDLRRYTKEYMSDQYGKLDAAVNQKLFLANPGKHCDMCDRRPWCREMGLVDAEDGGS